MDLEFQSVTEYLLSLPDARVWWLWQMREYGGCGSLELRMGSPHQDGQEAKQKQDWPHRPACLPFTHVHQQGLSQRFHTI